MNTNFDFSSYDDINLVKGYDLFIDPNGSVYKIKKTRNMIDVNHNKWAERFLILNNKISIIDLTYLKVDYSPVEIMVNYFGYVYYSHDNLLFQPIIKTPNPKYNKKMVSEEQLDTLTNIMVINNENPFDVPMIMGEKEEYDYVKCLRRSKYE